MPLPPFEPTIVHISRCWFCKAALKFHDDNPHLLLACTNMPFHNVDASGVVLFTDLNVGNIQGPRVQQIGDIVGERIPIMIHSDDEDDELATV